MSNYFYFRILPEGLLCDTERDLLSVAKFLHLWWIFCLTIGRVEFDAQIPATNSSRSTQTWRSSSSYLQWIWSSDSAADDVITRDYQWPRVDLWLRRDLCLSGDHVYCSHCLPKPTGKLTRHKFFMPRPAGQTCRRRSRLVRLSVRLFVCYQICETIFRKRMNTFWHKWSTGHARTERSTLEVGGQTSRSHETEDKFGGMAKLILDPFERSRFSILLQN